MNDCSNAEIRDKLPDLLHDRLSVSARAVVLAHVDGCSDCRDELELLRGMHGAIAAATPRVDIAYVVGALPKAPSRTTVPVARIAKRRWADWRVAAAVTLLVAGGSSVAILNRAPTAPETGLAVSIPVTDTQSSSTRTDTLAPRAVASAQSVAVASRATIASADDQDATTDAGPDGRFGGLSEAQLQALLGEIDRLEAVPVTEPEPVTIKVNVGLPVPLPELEQ